MAEILVVDDERAVREGLKACLLGEGFSVRTARDGDDALRKIAERRPDLLLLDVMMPKMNGFRVCEEVRKTDALLPVVFLTARDADGDQVRAFGLGGDDYVPKTASSAVLLVRIRRALSRAQSIGAQSAARTEIRLGNVTVDLKTFAVAEDGRETARLTKTEADILALLATARGELFTIEDIISALRGKGFACEDAMVYVHVGNLRRKLGPAAGMIISRRSAGYGLAK